MPSGNISQGAISTPRFNKAVAAPRLSTMQRNQQWAVQKLVLWDNKLKAGYCSSAVWIWAQRKKWPIAEYGTSTILEKNLVNSIQLKLIS